MNKLLCQIFLLSIPLASYSSPSPNEENIYFHIHQATRWAELHYSKNILFASQEMRKHLGKIKFSEVKLVKSSFYKEFLYLNKLALNMKNGSYGEIEKFRANIHSKAEKLNVKHPDNWQDEFVLVR